MIYPRHFEPDCSQKYAAVFYYGSAENIFQPSMKLNCANSATTFYALLIYLERTGPSSFGAFRSPAVQRALSQLLTFARHVCPTPTQQPLYEFQWSLFIASIETNDSIHQEWLQDRIFDSRYKTASQRILDLKRTSGVVHLSMVKQILQGVT